MKPLQADATTSQAEYAVNNVMAQAAASLEMRAVAMPMLLGMLTLALVFLAGAMFNAVVLPTLGWTLVALFCGVGLLSVVWSESGSGLFRLWAIGGWSLIVAVALFHVVVGVIG